MSESGPRIRYWSMRLHRWVALTLGSWFALLGLTGMLLVWHGEIDRALNPAWFAPRLECHASQPKEPVRQVLNVYAHAHRDAATQVMASEAAGAAYVVWSKATKGGRTQHFIDAACGRYLGSREWGAVRLDRAHLVPALYELHRSLLSGDVGHVLVGAAGLWLLGVTITGAINAWPRTSTRTAWTRTLTVKAGAGRRRRYYDLHRATGMWLLPFLLLMSISGAYLCFPKQARTLVAGVLPTAPPVRAVWYPAPATGTKGQQPGPDDFVNRSEKLWTQATWSRLQLPAKAGDSYEVRLLQAGEPRKDTGDTRVRFGPDGRVLEIRDPLSAPAGDTVIAWLFPLHSGEALGTTGRVAWTVFGTLPLLLFVTGVWLWIQRRSSHAVKLDQTVAKRPVPRPIDAACLPVVITTEEVALSPKTAEPPPVSGIVAWDESVTTLLVLERPLL